ncbi:tryptophan synthase subunit beta [Ascoidea rubescens DSM 1968]|uniref:Tryptophan synthase n=1 Tax=Ascoidea rubescens DSM 1968 TaxID=1344418 RepID=A0A1D2VS99_9ASCO|nr:tryptophan synthase beta subunit [Ascoidea rubescens DSM 1968]ODV64483.1 tryptophan synthase beta subunit [Ascoidea rubescens DSM 1968]
MSQLEKNKQGITLTKPYLENYPDKNGFFGPYGGCFVPPEIEKQMKLISEQYDLLKNDPEYLETLSRIRSDFQGRPTPLFFARNLSKYASPDKNIKIYLKREDLNHMGAHKLNHCMAEALIALKLGKKKIIAETGAGQHGVALATAAAYFNLKCDIYMGEIDIIKEKPNVVRMKILGANVIPATHGLKSLKEAVDIAFENYMKDPENIMYCIGSVVGPHPFPLMVRDFQSVIGTETKKQFKLKNDNKLPEHIVACCGGGSNAAGIFSAFIDDEDVKLYAVEPLGDGTGKLGSHAASISYGEDGVMHGFNSIMIKNLNDNEPGPVNSIASGLDYPSVGPEQALWFRSNRTEKNVGATDLEAVDAFFALSKLEGIIPALESSHAIAYALKLAKNVDNNSTIVVNLSGRGDKDIDYVVENYPQFIDKKYEIQ